MLFNSYAFIFFFVPVVFFLFRALSKLCYASIALVWLTLASFFFYSYWNPPFVFLLIFSVVTNYGLGRAIQKIPKYVHLMMIFGITLNLALIVYFKYANFFMDSLASIGGWHWTPRDIFLPLGISFFTFQQIAFLIETYRGEIRNPSFLHYALFVSFFPQLIAGPIVRYTDVVPSFMSQAFLKKDYRNIAVGLFLFSIGLAKKVLIADTLSPWVSEIFDGKEPFMFAAAWSGALAYTFQIYFDFSGYSDMAMGLGKLFNVEIPLNFYSPYKALSITDFWRRWHMTLSSFLRDYLYIPLGGNRKGIVRRYGNLLITMTLGGLWHGASWNFVFWGAYHGMLLILHKMITNFFTFRSWKIPFSRWGAWAVTFLLVVVGWVFFRANSLSQAFNILAAMMDVSSFPGLSSLLVWHLPEIGFCLLICLFAPASFEMMLLKAPEAINVYVKISYAAFLFLFAAILMGSKPTEFLYFQF